MRGQGKLFLLRPSSHGWWIWRRFSVKLAPVHVNNSWQEKKRNFSNLGREKRGSTNKFRRERIAHLISVRLFFLLSRRRLLRFKLFQLQQFRNSHTEKLDVDGLRMKQNARWARKSDIELQTFPGTADKTYIQRRTEGGAERWLTDGGREGFSIQNCITKIGGRGDRLAFIKTRWTRICLLGEAENTFWLARHFLMTSFSAQGLFVRWRDQRRVSKIMSNC